VAPEAAGFADAAGLADAEAATLAAGLAAALEAGGGALAAGAFEVLTLAVPPHEASSSAAPMVPQNRCLCMCLISFAYALVAPRYDGVDSTGGTDAQPKPRPTPWAAPNGTDCVGAQSTLTDP
jgi:hypothetical protein